MKTKLTRYTPIHAHQLADVRGRLGDKDVQIVANDHMVTLKIVGMEMAINLHLSRGDAKDLAQHLLTITSEAERVALMGA